MRFIPVLAALALLSGCSTMVNGMTQDITIETPGTVGALCFIERPGYKHRVWAPKTIRINKTKDPITVTCRAQGNREIVEVIEPTRPDTVYLNFANAFVPGALIDYETGAMFRFPEVITIDFTDMKPQKMPYPDYEYMLEKNPDLMGIEEFRPGTSALMRDKYYSPTPLRERMPPEDDIFSDIVTPGEGGGVSAEEASVSPEVQPPTSSAAVSSSPRAAIGSTAGETADSLTRRMNPSIFQGGSSTATSGAAPIPSLIDPVGGNAANAPVPLSRSDEQ